MYKDPDYDLLKSAENYFSDLWRSLSIWREFRSGFTRLNNFNNCVTFFGSARLKEDSPFYQLAFDTACEVGKAGYPVMTGGGPGLMEAANKGARHAGTTSIGCNIMLSDQQEPNSYLDISIDFNYFFVRKVMLLKYSTAFILLPGGFGTTDEFFETANLIVTRKIRNFPVILMGRSFWKPMQPLLEETMLSHGTIDESDLEFIRMTDSPEEAVAMINRQDGVRSEE